MTEDDGGERLGEVRVVRHRAAEVPQHHAPGVAAHRAHGALGVGDHLARGDVPVDEDGGRHVGELLREPVRGDDGAVAELERAAHAPHAVLEDLAVLG